MLDEHLDVLAAHRLILPADAGSQLHIRLERLVGVAKHLDAFVVVEVEEAEEGLDVCLLLALVACGCDVVGELGVRLHDVHPEQARLQLPLRGRKCRGGTLAVDVVLPGDLILEEEDVEDVIGREVVDRDPRLYSRAAPAARAMLDFGFGLKPVLLVRAEPVLEPDDQVWLVLREVIIELLAPARELCAARRPETLS